MVTQVIVKCLCRTFFVADLGITLEKGAEVVLTEEVARSSKDLAHARMVGAVSVRFETVCLTQHMPQGPAPTPQTPRMKSPPSKKSDPPQASSGMVEEKGPESSSRPPARRKKRSAP